MLLEIFVSFALILLLDYLWRKDRNKLLQNIPGPTSYPLFGSAWLYFGTKPDELLKLGENLTKQYGRLVKFWIFHINAIFTSDMKYIQVILSHPTEIKKNRMYSLLDDWLGEGLLTSYGAKWLARRRAITPAFHFKILESFVHIFDQQAVIFASKLKKYAIEKNTKMEDILGSQQYILDVEHYIALATLDVICETAMGVRINAQTDENCEYVKNLIEMQNIFLKRFVNVSQRSDKIFKIMAPKSYARYRHVMTALHNFTESIIEERRKEMLSTFEKNEDKNNKTSLESKTTTEDYDYGSKKHLALLDILLSSTIDGKPLTNADVREEVDTFMFEGHDTTKSGIGFTLYCLSREPAIQQKVFEELQLVLEGNLKAPLSYNNLMDLKYLEKVIKESLRMYPPVPFIGRQIERDVYVDNQCIAKGTSILMALITMQNDPKYFENPHQFLPERDLKENTFAFVPFSAGPRNCIGQKFAMLEMKTFLARTVQSYELLPLGEVVDPTVSVVLKSKTGWQMGLRKRY